MKKLIFLFSIITTTLIGCSDSLENPASNFVSFESENYAFGVDIDGSSTNSINVYSGNIASTDRTFYVDVVATGTTADPASYSVPESFIIPANSNNGKLDITISDVNIGAGKKLTIAFRPEVGVYAGQDIVLDIKQVCPFNDVKLKIVFDGYASETSFELKNDSGTVVGGVAAGTWADGLEDYAESFCLPAGNYTFTVGDAYGDGLSYPENGTVELKIGTTVLFSVVGDFGSSKTGTFTLP